MIARRPLLSMSAGCLTATALGVVLGAGAIVATASALALVAALAVTSARGLLPARRRVPPPSRRKDAMPLQLRRIVDALAHAEVDADRSLRPLLAPIVAARLGRLGIDMASAPERARELLGDRLWEIVGPDRGSVAHRTGRGIAGDELQAAIERIERL